MVPKGCPTEAGDRCEEEVRDVAPRMLPPFDETRRFFYTPLFNLPFLPFHLVCTGFLVWGISSDLLSLGSRSPSIQLRPDLDQRRDSTTASSDKPQTPRYDSRDK